jgi:spermidine synthase
MGIALFAALSPWLYYDVIYLGLLPLASSPTVTFVVVFAGLLWPTFLMGCSLPFLSKAVVLEIKSSARLIGWLYGVNTFGAATGAFVGGWFLIGAIGFDKAIFVGAALNLVVAAGGISLARGIDRAAAVEPRQRLDREARSDAHVWRWSLLVFVSGFLIVALQIVWYRLIGILMQSNSYSFSLVLAVFLAGDAAGLIVGTYAIARITHPLRFFFLMQGAAAALALAGIWFIYLAIGTGILPATFVDRDVMAGQFEDMALIALLLAVTVLPASVVIGMSFPVVQKAVQQDIERLGQRVGLVQLANIFGNSAGALVTGLLLLNILGTANTVKLLAVVGLAFAVLQAVALRSVRQSAVPAVVLAAGLVWFPGNEALWRRIHGLVAERAIVAEDRTGLAVLKLNTSRDGKLYIQGHSQSRLPFDTVHEFLGVIGSLTHGRPREVLVIGSGTGGTAYAAGVRPETEHVRVFEIVAPVVATLQQFVRDGGGSGVDELLAGKRFEVIVADGRHALALEDRRYDVIEADAILPKTALSGLLNSQEFFRQVKSKLAPGGIYVQWAPTARSIETFRSVFPYVTMVHPAMVGSDQPIAFSRDRILQELARPEVQARLVSARVDVGELRQWFVDKKVERLNDGTVVPAAEPNTDFFPRDEYYLNSR